jgi:hypothetical protein
MTVSRGVLGVATKDSIASVNVRFLRGASTTDRATRSTGDLNIVPMQPERAGRVCTSVFANSCCSVFLTALSEISIREAISLFANPWTTSRSASSSRSLNGARSCWFDAIGLGAEGWDCSSLTSAMIAASFGGVRHCIDVLNYGRSSHRKAWCSSGRKAAIGYTLSRHRPPHGRPQLQIHTSLWPVPISYPWRGLTPRAIRIIVGE